jgi:signal transduction histidine kinase
MQSQLRSDPGTAGAAFPGDPEFDGGRTLDAGARRRFDVAIAAAIGILIVITILTLLPGGRLFISNGSLDTVLNTLTSGVAAGAAALAWVRYRIERDVSAVFESSAFVVLFATRALIVTLASLGGADSLGLTIDAPQQWPLYAWSLARLVSAILLILAAAATLRQVRSVRVPALVLELGPLVALLLVFLAILPAEPNLPTFLGPQGIAALRGDPTATPGLEPLGFITAGVIGIAYLGAAAMYHRIASNGGRAYARYLTIALVVAGFSQVHWAIFPGIYRPLVTVDDLLRAVFSVILLLGIGAQFSGDLSALRGANARLRALRTTDAERAALEARARLAREVHDGLSQDLWLAKLKQARLARIGGLPAEAGELVTEVGDAIGRALENARSVLETMREASPGRSVNDSIERLVAEFEAGSGIRVEVAGLETLPVLEPAAEGELVRILREAMLNVEKHADATVVRITAVGANGAGPELRVADNGRGFDPTDIGAASFGIRGMRERAALIGGSIDISSRPADGTTVAIRLAGATAPVGARS